MHIPTEIITQKIDIGWFVSKEPSISASVLFFLILFENYLHISNKKKYSDNKVVA